MRLKLQQKTQTPQKVKLISLEYLLTGAKKMGKKNIRRIVFLFTIELVKLLVRFFPGNEDEKRQLSNIIDGKEVLIR